ncbi:MAG: hypothetical protein ACXVM0_15580 [Flavisolibacter sp.]
METQPIEMASWIWKACRPLIRKDVASGGITIDQLIPLGYECYAKILHPFEEDIEKTDALAPHPTYGKKVSLSLRHLPDGQLGTFFLLPDGSEIDVQEQYGERQKEYASKKRKPVTWQSLAEKYGLVFHNQIHDQSYVARFQKIGWPENLIFPSEGRLPRATFEKLLHTLRDYTGKDELYIFQYPPHSLYREGKGADLVRCSYAEVRSYFEEDFVGYLYGIDHSWVVFTDTDLYFTLVGGSQALIHAIGQTELEILTSTGTTRVDCLGDRINDLSGLQHPNRSSDQVAENKTPANFFKQWWKALTKRK